MTRRASLALATLYVVWGSTFVAVMIAIRSFPALALSSLRYGLAGVVVSSLAWAGSSLYARRTSPGGRPLTSAGLQMVSAAGLLAVASGTGGELGRLHLGRVSPASWGAFVYLAVVGSLVGYLCFIW